ncbi:glucose/sorbosone dehydrogenase [Caulobacter sp. AP07]|uniref:PQQ-dependent sugar dehydrogenase n=1 Tax=Caulobacter sp. AP07 TaxID=1144304 RepID=UPI000271E8BA|nr:PQQ-dependent sugar dehydrogenase [Caulobacter sp. AP07]EJL32887.1 glucose/sorbosone dehydrogenase [Caulobacter sp. AP07]
MKLKGVGVLLGLSLIATGAAQAAPRVAYKVSGICDGWPRLAIDAAPGMCAGLVAGPTPGAFAQRQLRLPRTLVPLDDGRTWLVADLADWTRPRGVVWRLTVEPGQPVRLEPLLTGLSLPHGLAIGPDGLAYVGEMSRIFRFDPRASDPAATVAPVITDLPDNRLHDNRHPLSQFVFAADGALLVNVGAPSDQCLDDKGARVGTDRCDQSEGDEATAGIRRYALVSPGRWSPDFTMLARGLRNSVALAVHPSGTVLQAENSYDLPDRWSPFEELNRIEAGKHYGWPYCMDRATPTPGAWSGAMDCASAAHTPPVALLPPHVAPLAMTWYQGAMFPALRGKLLMSWHGYRSTGGRLAAFAVDAKGLPVTRPRATFPTYPSGSRPFGAGPAAQAEILTPGWGKVDGVRPQGTPVGIAMAGDGAIWVADDKNASIIRFAVDRP